MNDESKSLLALCTSGWCTAVVHTSPSFGAGDVYAEGDAEDGGMGILRREGYAGVAHKGEQCVRKWDWNAYGATLMQSEDAAVTTKQKRAYQKKAAGYVSDLILDSLEGFPDDEQEVRLKNIHAALNGRSSKTVARKDAQKLEQAAKRMTEIVLEQMSTLSPERAKAVRGEIRRLAGRRTKK